jgi:hypothetical protein
MRIMRRTIYVWERNILTPEINIAERYYAVEFDNNDIRYEVDLIFIVIQVLNIYILFFILLIIKVRVVNIL